MFSRQLALNLNTPKQAIERAVQRSIRETLPTPARTISGETRHVNSHRHAHSDYTCTLPFPLAKEYNTSPPHLANSFMPALQRHAALFDTHVHQHGALRFTVTREYLLAHLETFIGAACVPVVQRCYAAGDAQSVLVDYASPNVAKELHVGHLRSAILGDVVCNVMELLGHSVHRVSHVGDFGTPVALVVARALHNGASWARVGGSSVPSVGELTQLYMDAKRSQSGPFRSTVRRVTRQLQAAARGERAAADGEDVAHAWRVVCEASRAAYGSLFARLRVGEPREYGESKYAPMLADIVQRVQDAGLTRVDNDALVVDSCKSTLVLRKRDSSFLYSTTDLAAVWHRTRELGVNRAIYVVDGAQALHFKQVFDVARRAGLAGGDTALEHMSFGVIQGADGKKFSTRDGTGMPLQALLDEAKRRAGVERVRLARAKELDAAQQLSVDETQLPAGLMSTDQVDERVGVASIKYFDLAHDRARNYRFDFDRMLEFRGNTAVYLLYAHSRILALLRKAHVSGEADLDVARGMAQLRALPLAAGDVERELLLCVSQFSDVVLDFERTLTPHTLCEFAHSLAEKFHRFYAARPILKSDERQSRLLLCFATHKVLLQTFALLGIAPPDRL